MKKPNIVLVVMDTARALNFPMYGYERNTSPFLLDLSKKSVVYKNAFSNAPWTLPSHASLFTGKLSSEHKVLSFGDKLPDDNLVARLKQKGYYTLGISNNAWISNISGFDKPFDKFILNSKPKAKLEIKDKDKKRFEALNAALTGGKRSIIKFIKYCLRKGLIKELIITALFFVRGRLSIKKFIFIDKGARKTNKRLAKELKQIREPFFIFLNYIEVHGPYSAPKRIERIFIDKRFTKKEIAFVKRRDKIARLRNHDEKELEILRSLYDAGIYYLDSRLKEMYELFVRRGLDKNTIFVFTSDHGDFLGEHGLFEHMLALYKEVVKIPLIIKYPTNKRGIVNEVFSLTDLYNLILNEFKESKKKGCALAEYYGADTHNNVSMFGGVKREILHKGVMYSASSISKNGQYIEWEDGSNEYIPEKNSKKSDASILKKTLHKILGDLSKKKKIYLMRKKLENTIKKLRGGMK